MTRFDGGEGACKYAKSVTRFLNGSYRFWRSYAAVDDVISRTKINCGVETDRSIDHVYAGDADKMTPH